MASAKLLCAVSVDLDEIYNYHAIHGINQPADTSANLVYDLAIDRLADFAKRLDIPLTLFAVGADLTARPENGVRLKQMLNDGHEIANHSLDHLYNLTKQPREEVFRQVVGGAQAIENAVGQRPFGFRAPGYVINPNVIDAVVESGAIYDSSVFPCPMYYSLKAAKMGAIAVRGRSSRSVVDHPHVLLCPTQPYRMGNPYYQRGQGLLELPVQVTRGPRFPFIGTMLTMAGLTGAKWLTKLVLGEPVINLELHGIDVLDESDGLADLHDHQPDVHRSVSEKLEIFEVICRMIRAHGYQIVRLQDIAANQ